MSPQHNTVKLFVYGLWISCREWNFREWGRRGLGWGSVCGGIKASAKTFAKSSISLTGCTWQFCCLLGTLLQNLRLFVKDNKTRLVYFNIISLYVNSSIWLCFSSNYILFAFKHSITTAIFKMENCPRDYVLKLNKIQFCIFSELLPEFVMIK